MKPGVRFKDRSRNLAFARPGICVRSANCCFAQLEYRSQDLSQVEVCLFRFTSSFGSRKRDVAVFHAERDRTHLPVQCGGKLHGNRTGPTLNVVRQEHRPL